MADGHLLLNNKMGRAYGESDGTWGLDELKCWIVQALL